MSQKLPKISALTALGLTGWLLPLATPLPLPLEGFSLAMGLFSSAALTAELKRETIVSGVKSAERKLTLERVAYQMSLEHEAELQRLRGMYGIGADDDYEDEDDREEQTQPTLTGSTIHQTTLPGGNPVESFDLDWLLRSDSQHLLVTGPTGAGKTTFTKWVAGQFNARQGKVYDPDYDGSDWGFPVTEAPLEDYTEIRGNMRVDLSEFEKRKPNDPANPKTVLIVEEMPSTIPECAEDGEKWLKLLLRRGRKRNLFVIGVSQDRNADTFKLKSAAVLSNFTVIYLGGYGEGALDRVRDRREREAIRAELRQSKRPALVQFQGRFYPWDIPNLTTTAATAQPQNPVQQTVQAIPGDAPGARPTSHDPDPIALLERSLKVSLKVTGLHWRIIDLAIAKGGLLSARDAQRELNIPTADAVRGLFNEVQSLELGEVRVDRLPNGMESVKLRAYPPMG
jgi:energy-coupling factor transporter ATP-binding protein EcfA2